MPTQLNTLPVRVPIGRVTDRSGNVYDVLMTPELARLLSDLMARVGGPTGFSTDELSALVTTAPTDTATLASLQHQVADLSAQLAAANAANTRMGVIEQRLEDLARLLHSTGPVPIDWEHPGKIGDKTPNSVRVTTLNKIKFTQPATVATFTLIDGKTFTVSNTLTLAGTDAATLNIGAGGTLGTAAFAAASTFATRPATTLGAPATDPASTTNLANNMRVALLAAGIGT